jgi:hypothetical protein
VKYASRIRLLERHHAERRSPTRPPTAAAIADAIKRLYRGVRARAGSEIAGRGGWPEAVGLFYPDPVVEQLTDEAVVALHVRYLAAIAAGVAELPADCLGCPTPSHYRRFGPETVAAMSRGAF